jgi:serine/threonine protein kinase
MSQPISDEAFGGTAINLGMVTEAQLDECVKIQAEMRAMGIAEGLSAVLIKKGYLTQAQVTQILRTMGVQVQPIPGYQILGRLGAGGMGTVYKAKQTAMDRTVAIKVLSKQATQAKDFLSRFFREAQAAAKLNHPNVIQAFDAGCANQIYYFVMEFVDGRTARHLLEQGRRMPEKEALQLAVQICEALDYIHKHGMVHRDIKPENVMITRDGAAKLCDFGLAKSTEVDSSITRSGFTFGTPYYMSPEQINGARDVDIRADLYSLGATLFHLIVGRPVFDGKDLREVLTRHLTEPPPLASDAIPTVSERTSRVIQKMLQKDRADRYQTPRQAIEDIHQILRGNDPRNAKRRQRRSPSVAWIGVAAAVLVVAGVAGVAYVLNRPAPPPSSPPPPVARQPEPAPARPAPPSPDSRAPEPPTPIKPLDERQVQAERLFAQAKAAFDLKDWNRAHDLYARLDAEFIDVPFVLDRKSEIWERIAESRTKLDEIARGDRAEEELRRFKVAYDAALLLIQGGQWREAREALTELLPRRMPEGFSPAELSSRIDRCTREIDAERAWSGASAAARERRWEAAEAACREFRTAFAGTRAHAAHESEAREIEARASREAAATRMIEEIRAANGRGDWGAVATGVDQAAAAWSGTDAWAKAKDELAKLASSAREAAARPKEEQAQKAWDAALGAIKEEQWDIAGAEIAKLHGGGALADTQFAKEKKGAIPAKVEEIEAGRARAHETAAKNLYRNARQRFDRKEYEDALTMFKELQEKYPEAKAIKTSGRAIADFVAKCEREIHMAKAALIDDFEREELKDSGWRKSDPANFELSDEAVAGRRGLRLNFGRHDRNPGEGAWPRVFKEFPEGSIPSETVAVTFWARVARPDVNSTVWVEVRTGSGPGAASYALEIAVTPKWKQYRVYLNSLKLVWGGDDLVRQRARPPLEIAKIRSFGLAMVNPSGELPLAIDDIRLEYYR